MTLAMKINRLIALAGSVLTLLQIFLLASHREGICFNDGCSVVDSLTNVPPIFINIGGFLFFQAVFWGIWLARVRHERLWIVRIILLAGLAAEGVLLSFQHLIAQTFCSYCLIILALVVLLNIFSGFRQTLGGVAVFFAVVIGFLSLQFGVAGNNSLEKLDTGSLAYLAGNETEKHYLFFSSTCKYCEKVIVTLEKENSCAIRFNPIDEITDFSLIHAKKFQQYSIEINRKFLKSMGVDQIPVLLNVNDSGFQIIKGEASIQDYLREKCTADKTSSTGTSAIGISPAASSDFLPPILDNSCTVDSDCDDPAVPRPPQ